MSKSVKFQNFCSINLPQNICNKSYVAFLFESYNNNFVCFKDGNPFSCADLQGAVH